MKLGTVMMPLQMTRFPSLLTPIVDNINMAAGFTCVWVLHTPHIIYTALTVCVVFYEVHFYVMQINMLAV